MIKTKSIYDAVDAYDGIRIIIMRHFPRNIGRKKFDLYFGELCPTAYDLQLYKNGKLTFDELIERMEAFLAKSERAQQQLRVLAKMDHMYMPVTLLCVEKEGERCHRYKIRDMIEQVPRR